MSPHPVFRERLKPDIISENPNEYISAESQLHKTVSLNINTQRNSIKYSLILSFEETYPTCPLKISQQITKKKKNAKIYHICNVKDA